MQKTERDMPKTKPTLENKQQFTKKEKKKNQGEHKNDRNL
jgi:hypothetical protein